MVKLNIYDPCFVSRYFIFTPNKKLVETIKLNQQHIVNILKLNHE